MPSRARLSGWGGIRPCRIHRLVGALGTVGSHTSACLGETSETGTGGPPTRGQQASEQGVSAAMGTCRQPDDSGHLYHKNYSFDDPGAIDY